MDTTVTTDDTASAALQALDLVVAAKPGAEHRAGQHEMCAAVATALEARHHLLVEAPTGTGKSVAYAVAAVLHAHRHVHDRAPDGDDGGDGPPEPARVVVTTATKALQEQLCDEDLPLVQRVLAAHDLPFSFALLKGRSNYVCPAKLDELAGGAEPEGMFEARTNRERDRGAALAQVREWAERTPTGDRAELDDDVPDDVWQAVSTTARDCPGVQACHAGERCFAEAARARARAAEVIVVNTALYGAHVASGRFVLPTHDAVVVDEAHLCEDVFADQLGVDIHGGRLRNLAAMAQRIVPKSDAPESLRACAHRLDITCAEIAGRADPRVRACEGDLAELLGAVRRAVGDTARALKEADVERGTPAASRQARAVKAAQTLDHEVGMALDEHVYDTHVAWCEVESGNARLVLVPVVVGDVLARELFPHVTVVATSATLAVGGRFDAIAGRLGLDRQDAGESGDRPPAPWSGQRVPSPFDFREQAVLYVPRHLPDPRHTDYTAALADELHGLISAAGGRTLALFTSWKAMHDVADRCAAHGEYEVLRQGERPRRVLLDALKDAAASGGVVVFATMSFWTGVDVAGLGVSLVAIDRIPFPRPNDPLHAARRARATRSGLDAFATVDVPRAAVQLAQGAGRLIRHRGDRGVVAVLDRRLATAGYRRALLDTMPAFRRSVDGEAVRAYLREITGADAGNPPAPS